MWSTAKDSAWGENVTATQLIQSGPAVLLTLSVVGRSTHVWTFLFSTRFGAPPTLLRRFVCLKLEQRTHTQYQLQA